MNNFTKTPTLNRITCKHIKPKIRNSNKIIWRRYIKDLPEEIREKVLEYIQQNTITERCCWFNSTLLSIKNDEIDIVNGWYGIKMDKNELNTLVHTKKPKERFLRFSDGGEVVSIVDTDKGIKYDKHSWNKYKDVHFCITTELDCEFKGTFVYLNEQEIVSGKSITCNPSTKNEYFSICSSILSRSTEFGLRILNK